MVTKTDLAREWLPRYTGMPIDKFGDYVLLTNFENYFIRFVTNFDCEVYGGGRPM
ncbi:MAG: AMP nucleosidase, partial [Gemmatimonadales bacterium]